MSTQQRVYPPNLVPSPGLRIITHIDGDHILGRSVSSEVVLKDEDGTLSSGAIEVEYLQGFSTNKIPSSNKADLFIEFTCEKDLKKEYLSDWLEGEDGITPEPDHWKYSEKQLYFIKISGIDGYEDEFRHPDHKDLIKYRVKVVHVPKKTNYWHFELRLEGGNGLLKRIDKGKKWQHMIFGQIVQRIQSASYF